MRGSRRRCSTSRTDADELQRLLERRFNTINQLVDRVESSLKQALQLVNVGSAGAASASTAAHANALTAFVVGRWQLYAKSGFKRSPSEYWTEQAAFFRV